MHSFAAIFSFSFNMFVMGYFTKALLIFVFINIVPSILGLEMDIGITIGSRTCSGSMARFSCKNIADYNVTLLYSRDTFLVDIINENIGRVLNLDSISSGQMWLQNDILIFNSWHWWTHTRLQQPWDFIQYGGKVYKDMDRLVAFEKGLKTWARWVKSKVDPNKAKVYFLDTPPSHTNASEWGDRTTMDCLGQTSPLKPPYPGGPNPVEAVVKRVLRSTTNKVQLLEITSLSQLRPDGHSSIYGFGGSRFHDCSHWCLPGVPDTWNELFYASLFTN